MQVPVAQIPDINGYREAVEAIHPDLKKTSVARGIVDRIDSVLSKEKVTCLLCTDNGSGLNLNEYRSLLAEAMSAKVDDAGSGKLGSVGVGHLTAINASNLRYVLYSSRGSEGTLFGGQALLASQLRVDDGKAMLRVGRGCLTAADRVADFRGYEASPADPTDLPEWLSIPPIQGTTVAILAYSSLDEDAASAKEGDLVSDPYQDQIFGAIAKHFMVALQEHKLQVTYSSNVRNNVVLDENEIRRCLQAKRDKRRSNKGRRMYGSGASAWASWETLAEGHKLPCEQGSLWYQLTPDKTTKVVVFRNGMRITDDAPKLRSGDFTGVKAFTAVFNAEGELADAIKDCETDSHLEIKISQAPRSVRCLVQKGLQAVQDVLKQAAGEIETERWLPDVLRIFDAENVPSKVEPAPPRPRPQQPDSEQQPLPTPDTESETAPDGPSPPSPEPVNPSDNPQPKPVKPQAWRPGNLEGVRRSFVPLNDKEAIVEWDFTSDIREPAAVGVAVVVGSGSQPSDRRPEPDRALHIRPVGGNADEWAEELRVPADRCSIRVEVRNAPFEWEAVTSIVSRRS